MSDKQFIKEYIFQMNELKKLGFELIKYCTIESKAQKTKIIIINFNGEPDEDGNTYIVEKYKNEILDESILMSIKEMNHYINELRSIMI